MKPAFEVLKDEIGPQLKATVRCSPPALEAATKQAAENVSKIIVKAWFTGIYTWTGLKISTIVTKAKLKVPFPFDPLRRSLDLERQVLKTDRFVKGHSISPTVAEIEYDWTSQFDPVSYMAFHELGAPKANLPQRSFLLKNADEIQKALEGAGAGLAVPVKLLKGEAEFKARPQVGKIPAVIFWLPLGNVFKYMGMYSDMYGILGGTMLQPELMENYMKAYFLGRTKYPTRKRIRRGIRRRIWR